MQQTLNKKNAVLVTTSVAMDEGAQAAIAKKVLGLVGGTPPVEFAVEAAILGGIQIEYNGALIDLSLRSELTKLVAAIKK